jgi:hypothetical protein
MGGRVNIGRVLAQLKKERREIDRAIAALESLSRAKDTQRVPRRKALSTASSRKHRKDKSRPAAVKPRTTAGEILEFPVKRQAGSQQAF